MSTRLGFDELAKSVVSKAACVGCGGCYVTCPFDGILDYIEGQPKLVGECRVCGICPRVCPRYKVDLLELDEMTFRRRRRTSEGTFGIHLSLQVSRATSDIVKECGQDGGVATALLLSALNSGMIDGAIVSTVDPNHPWCPIPILAKTREEILAGAGTKYTYSPGLLALKQNAGQSLKRIAFVGTPCQILAIRRMQKANLRKLVEPVVLTMGLFCSESFTYGGLMEERIQKGFGLDLHEVAKMNIKGKMQVTLKGGKILEIPLKEAKAFAQPSCRYCGDFSAELADISLGGVGLNGWTFVIVRTERGRQFFNTAVTSKDIEVRPAKEFQSALDLMTRLSVLKRKNAQLIA